MTQFYRLELITQLELGQPKTTALMVPDANGQYAKRADVETLQAPGLPALTPDIEAKLAKLAKIEADCAAAGVTV
jgi:hypothetical protein